MELMLKLANKEQKLFSPSLLVQVQSVNVSRFVNVKYKLTTAGFLINKSKDQTAGCGGSTA